MLKELTINYYPHFYFEKAKSLGDMPNMHYHQAYEIFYLERGEKKHFVGDTFFELKEGDFAVIPCLVPHKTGSPKNAYRYLIYFDETFLNKWFTPDAREALLRFFDKRFIRPRKEDKPRINEIFTRIEGAYNEHNPSKQFLALIELCTLLNDSPKAIMNGSPALLRNIMEYVHAHYATISSLEDVAEALFVSKYHICHLCSKYLELPFSTYLTQIRLKNASTLLLNTKYNVSKIAETCGFSSSTYFCNVFKKEYGVTPLAYRKLNEKK